MTVTLGWARTALRGPRPWIFLAGPTPRDLVTPSWRPDAVREFVDQGFEGTLLIPEDGTGEPFDDARFHDAQVHWEWEALDAADAIMFWVPRDLETLPGFTTNVKFGFYVRSGKIVLGAPELADKNRYLFMLAERCGVPRSHDLSVTVERAIALAQPFIYNKD